MSPILHDHEILKMNYIFSVPHYLACGWFLVQIFLFLFHPSCSIKAQGKKKGNSGHTVQSRFDRQKELKKWLRNEVLEQHEAEAESQVVMKQA